MQDAETRVTPIEGELFRYHVHSYTGSTFYLVDLSEEDFKGQCSCPQFTIRVAKARKAGLESKCKHIRRAIEFAWPAFGRAFIKEVEARGRLISKLDPLPWETDESAAGKDP